MERKSLTHDIEKTSASVPSEYPDTEEMMKAQGRFGQVLLLFRGVWII